MEVPSATISYDDTMSEEIVGPSEEEDNVAPPSSAVFVCYVYIGPSRLRTRGIGA